MKSTNRFAKFIIYLFGVISSINQVSSQTVGTTICFVRTPTNIYVGADSKRKIDNNGSHIDTTVCKIRKYGNTFLVVAGLVNYGDADFDIPRIAYENITGDILFKYQLARFDDTLLQNVRKAWKYIRYNNPELWLKMLSGLPTSTVIVFGFQLGIPYFYLRQYIAIEDSIHNFTAIDWIDEPRPQKQDTAVFFNAHYGNEPFSHSSIQGSIPNFIDSVISIAIRIDSSTSGYPIDILHLNSSGEHWIRRKQKCE